ncbi:hypothetical protein [Desulfosoma caldarium]|nr:hypothetical protein [Desulfosoma caldarium]
MPGPRHKRDRIKRHRAQDKGQESFQPDRFSRVALILERDHLQPRDLLIALDREPVEHTVSQALMQGEIRKAGACGALFGLVDPQFFGGVMEILRRVDSPYLPWAASRADLLLSRPLYALKSTIPPWILSRYSFAFLYRYYAAKR